MKNVLLIDTDGEKLVSSTHDTTNRLFINNSEISSSLWVGSGNYTATVEGHAITIAKVADLDGNIILVKNNDFNYSLLKSSTGGGGSGGVTSYEDLTDKPAIEGITLIGNKTYDQLNLLNITDGEIDELCPWQGGEGSPINYNALQNRPSIEGVILTGDKTFEELNLQRITNSEIENLLT